MIRFDHVTVTYPGASTPALEDVDLRIPEGELCLVVGGTGAGKSTLLSCVNGLVPHFSGGHLRGRVTIDGRDTALHPPRDFADLVGVVGQDPLAGFVTDVVEDELAYGMEQLGVAPAVMRKRVEETLDLLGIAELRSRPLRTLSGGQQQRVAIGAVLAMHPKVLVLDEPTSALDPTAAEEVLSAITRLVHDLGVTAVVAEHRLERVAQYADLLVVVDGATASVGEPAVMLETSPIAPGQLGGLIDLIGSGEISGKIAKDVFEILWTEGGDPAAIVEARGLRQVTDMGAIETAVDEIIAANPEKVAQAQAKPSMAGWFVGQVMKATGGKANPQAVNELVKAKLGL